MEATPLYKLRNPNELGKLVQQKSNILDNSTIWKINLDEDWKKLLEDMDTVDIKMFAVGSIELNTSRVLFNLLNNIHFTQLIELNNLNLDSFEMITHLNTPKLQYIRLNGNKITDVRIFRKLYQPLLRELIIDNNLIQDIAPLSAIYSRNEVKIMLTNKKRMPNVYHGRSTTTSNPIANYSPIFKLPKSFQPMLGDTITAPNSSVLTLMLKKRG